MSLFVLKDSNVSLSVLMRPYQPMSVFIVPFGSL